MTDADITRAILDWAGVEYIDRGSSLGSNDYMNYWAIDFGRDGRVIGFFTRRDWDTAHGEPEATEAPADAEIAPRGLG